jgi:hypothetical protein
VIVAHVASVTWGIGNSQSAQPTGAQYRASSLPDQRQVPVAVHQRDGFDLRSEPSLARMPRIWLRTIVSETTNSATLAAAR